MRHLVLFAYVLLFSTGFAGLSALVFLSIRTRGAALPWLVAIQAVFLCALGLQTVVFYDGAVLTAGFRDVPLQVPLLEPLIGAATASLYLLGWAGFRAQGLLPGLRSFGRRPVRAAASVFTLATGLLMAAGTLSLLFTAVTGIGLPHVEFPAPYGYLLPAASVLFLGLVLVRQKPSGEHPAVLLLFRWYGAVLLAFVPLTALEALFELFPLPSLGPLSFDYLFFLGWNLASVAAFVRSIAVPAAPPLIDSVPASVAASFGLSPREVDMVLHIARGLSNKQIAAELGISETTVRTHIYNLFRKTGAGGRVELLNRIRAH